MKENLVRRKAVFMLIVASLFIGLLGIAQATITIIQQLNWSDTPVVITAANQSGNDPVLLLAPNGEMMIVYSHWNFGSVQFSNPFFSTSGNGGQTWSTTAPILSAPNNTSQVFMEGTYDALNVAHVAWVDFTPGQPFPQSRVFYSRREGTSWTTPTQLASQTNSPSPIELVDIVATGTDTLDMVWIEEEQLRHRRSTNSGASWSSTAQIAGTNAVANQVQLATDVNRVVYVVWEQRTGGQAGGPNIFFSQLADGAWSAPLLISTAADEQNKATFPAVTVSTSAVHVAYAYREDADSQTSPLFIATKRCPLTADCTALSSWSARTSLPPRMFVNADDPFFVVPDMVFDESVPAVHLYYHGILGDGSGNPVGNNEAIFGRDSCQDWQMLDQATSTDIRSIKPSIQARDGALFLAYEQVSSVSGETQIAIAYKRATFERSDGGAPCSATPTPLPGQPTLEPTITPGFPAVPTITPSPVPRSENDVYLPVIFRR